MGKKPAVQTSCMINVCPSVHWWSSLSITISWYRHTAENEAKSYSFASADNDITCINLHPESPGLGFRFRHASLYRQGK
jgi:hypothetical protein